MSILPVRLFGDPVLRSRADEVTEFNTNLKRLVADMHETMKVEGGVGLAANQVGVLQRVFVYEVDGQSGCVVNPVWKQVGEELQTDREGCLSIPGIGSDTTRANHVTCTGFDEDGNPVSLDATGLMARCIQHETDHLDGVLFLQRLEKDDRRAAMKKVRESNWFGSTATSRGQLVNEAGAPVSTTAV